MSKYQEMIERSLKGLETDEYNSDSDNLDYSSLIKSKYVLDSTGRVKVKEFTEEEKKVICSDSILTVLYVPSGRGAYDAWKSNLQKSVRRCDLDSALKSMIELANMGGKFLSNVINRLVKVMVSEDIGVANSNLAIDCSKFLKYYSSLKKQKDIEKDPEFRKRLILITTKITLSKKSRLVDNSLCITKFDKEKKNNDSWEELFEKLKGLEGTELEKIESGSAIIYNLCDKDGIIEDKSDYGEYLSELKRKKRKCYILWGYFFSISSKRVLEINRALYSLFDSGVDITGEGKLHLIHAYFNIILEDKIDLNSNVKVEKIKRWNDIEKKEIWIKDVSYDKHTRIGRSLGRDVYFFFRYGAKLKNKEEKLKEIEDYFYNRCVYLSLKM